MKKRFFGAALFLLCAFALQSDRARAQFGPNAPAGTPRHAQMRTGIYRGHQVTYAIVNGKAIFEGDIILDHVQDMPPGKPAAGKSKGPAVSIAYNQYLWPKGTSGVAEIPYIITTAATNLAAAISQFNATFTGVIQLVPRASQPDYVNFNFDPNDHSGTGESAVGRVGGEQSTGGSIDCSLGTLLHELGHVVGLLHEQSRPDRNTYVTVSYANVIKGSLPNFDQLIDDYQDLELYDYGSVMHYIAFAFSRNGGPVIESKPAGIRLSNLNGYTAADIDSVQRLYGTAPTSVTVTTNPPGLSVTVDGKKITTPQTFPWALNSTHTLAVPAGAQTLSGAAYTYGRWNDSTAASHTITVTPGNKTVVSPPTSPAVTVYSANFVSLVNYTSAVSPSGAGTVAASPLPKSYAGVSGKYFVERQKVKLTATANAGNSFLYWIGGVGGVNAPWSANPKSDYMPENSPAYAAAANFAAPPITTITTNPPGLGLYVDGIFYYGPQSFAWTLGSGHTVSSYTPQLPYSINSRYAFSSWSDRGALNHPITAGSTNTTFTANFTPQFVPVAYDANPFATPSCLATVSLTPSSPDGFYSKGTKVTFTANALAGWTLTGWLDDLKGVTNPQTLAINDEELAVANYNTTATPLAITSLNPASLTAGTSGAGQTITITGTGFTPSTYAYINNGYRASTPVSSTQITITDVRDSDLATAGAFPVSVSNFTATCSAYPSHTFFVTTP